MVGDRGVAERFGRRNFYSWKKDVGGLMFLLHQIGCLESSLIVRCREPIPSIVRMKNRDL
jgi:hypothetical protein